MFEAVQILAWMNGFMDQRQIVNEETALAVVKLHIHLDPKLHSIKLTSSTQIMSNLEIKQLKKTSLVFVVKLKTEQNDEIVGESFCKVVRFNRKTRQSIPFPEWYCKKYSPFVGVPGHPGTEKENLPKIPENAFETVICPTYSDQDLNGHVNNSSYIRYCMDAATRASLSGHYDHYTKDMCLYPSLQWTISYVGESRANDQLNIFTWQKENRPEQIYFAMLIDGQKIIFHASATFGKDVNETRFFHKL
jgi:acyl-CoA thioesterase FadM